MAQADGEGAFEALENGVEVLRQIRECDAAFRIGRTAGDDELDRALRVSRHVEPENFGGRHDSIQDYRTHALGEHTQVGESRPRTVREAVDVHALVSEGGPHLIEIGHGDARRVEPRFAGKGLEAARDPGADRVFVEKREVLHPFLGAAESVRAPGAALIHENDVALAVHPSKCGSELRVRLGRRLAWPAGQEHQRIGRLVPAHRGDDGDAKIDRPPLRSRSILGNPQDAAARGESRGRARGAELTRSKLDLRSSLLILHGAASHDEDSREEGATHPAAGR